jgi:CHAT domain-containing protein
MTYLDKKRRALLQKDYEAIDTTVLSLSNQIFDLEQELEALKKQFEEAYPAYHRLKYDRSTISISEVQQELLKPDQALLEYFVGDSSIFIFLIPKEGAPILKEVKKDFPLEDWVAKFREGVSNTNKVKTYLKYAQLLYDSLIQPVAEQLPERVIIVPDGVLGYLPFSALLSGQPGNIGNPKTYPFLLKEHQFSYSYSATLLKEMRDKEHRHQAEGQLLAFAPFFESEIAGITEQRSDAWKKLPFTGPEVKRVASFFPKKYLIFSGKKATK